MPPKAKAIFFDLGETLVTQNVEDSMVTKNALQEISKLLPAQVSPATLFKTYKTGYQMNNAIRTEYNVEIPIIAWMHQLLRKVTGTEPEDVLVEKCIKIIVKARAANALPFEDAHDTLRKLSKRPVKLAVMSNVSSHEVAQAILTNVRLAKYFHVIITSALTGIRKPDPGIFRYAMYQLKIKPTQAVIVGDSESHDIQGGYVSGLQTVLISRRRRVEHSIADYQFKTLKEAARRLLSL